MRDRVYNDSKLLDGNCLMWSSILAPQVCCLVGRCKTILKPCIPKLFKTKCRKDSYKTETILVRFVWYSRIPCDVIGMLIVDWLAVS